MVILFWVCVCVCVCFCVMLGALGTASQALFVKGVFGEPSSSSRPVR